MVVGQFLNRDRLRFHQELVGHGDEPLLLSFLLLRLDGPGTEQLGGELGLVRLGNVQGHSVSGFTDQPGIGRLGQILIDVIQVVPYRFLRAAEVQGNIPDHQVGPGIGKQHM